MLATKYYTVELRFRTSLPRETKIGSRNREVRNIGGEIKVKQVQGKQLLVRVIGVFEKSRVREIGVPLTVIYSAVKKNTSKTSTTVSYIFTRAKENPPLVPRVLHILRDNYLNLPLGKTLMIENFISCGSRTS